jgi:glycosyltransferase involved in cell wall biosynthesis
VAAVRLGAVPEIVEEGVTGVTAADVSGVAAAVRAACGLDRRRVREAAERRFSADRMAREYLRVYESLAR